jgi:hypothetical protein
LHVETLIAAKQLDKALQTLRVYEALVETCQSTYFTREVARLQSMLADQNASRITRGLK